MPDGKRVFISYSHDSKAHKQWVHELATYLMKSGIEVLLDQWEVDFGDDLAEFMEKGITKTDRVLMICTDAYIRKAGARSGGVGYEKTIATAEILRNDGNRRKFIPVVRNVAGSQKVPSYLGAALYIDMSDGMDGNEIRQNLVRRICDVPIRKPTLGSSPFIPEKALPKAQDCLADANQLPSLGVQDRCAAFADRFSQAFPGVRGAKWFDDIDAIAKRLCILLEPPLIFQQGHLIWWWRGVETSRSKHLSTSKAHIS